MPKRSDLKRRAFLAMAAASPFALEACNSGSTVSVTPDPNAGLAFAPTLPAGQTVADLRFGFSPTPSTFPGYDPAGDAKALFVAGTPSPATSPVPGTLATGSYATNERYVIKVPQNWNGKLAVVGTPAFRSEFASDFIWGEYLLSKGYAWASSNKGIPYNAIVEAASASQSTTTAYPIPFNLLNLGTAQLTIRFGSLFPAPIPIATWNADFVTLTLAAKKFLLTYFGKLPTRTYAVGTSNGGAQVRTLIESRPDLIDGGVDWEGVYWTPNQNIFTYMPTFLAAMPTYVASGYTDTGSSSAIVAAGYNPDVKQASATNPSLWEEYYSHQASFYTDLTVFAYSLLIDSAVSSSFSVPDVTPNANPLLPGTINGTGMALPANRGAYVPSAQARANIATFSHTGSIGKPLISIAGTSDMFITPGNNATPYLNAVKSAGRSNQYWQYLVTGGTHVDTFSVLGYGLQPQLPFAWASFDQLVAVVESGFNPPGAGTQQTVSVSTQIVNH